MQTADGKRQKAVGNGQWAVGNGQWAVGSRKRQKAKGKGQKLLRGKPPPRLRRVKQTKGRASRLALI